ncbi:MAG TPA: Ppx/GppA phosphatase family protein [Thermoleophilaceae bacterium]
MAAPARVAVVDLGTNSTRLLIADVQDGSVSELDRRTTVTRLGDGVDTSGRLSDEAMQRVLHTLASYKQRIDELQAATTVAVATSAVRDAANGDEFRAALKQRFGIDARIIPGEEEGRLTFRGATAQRSNADARDTLVIDIGGGSTEYVVGTPGAEPGFHVSTRMGSVRHTERHLAHDPPTAAELERARRQIAEVIRQDVPERIRTTTDTGIAVAGTATSLAAIELELDPYDSDRVHGHQLTRTAIERILGQLAALTTEQRRHTKGLHPDRAPTIVAGAAILAESLRAFDLDHVEVSEADILHGCALITSKR